MVTRIASFFALENVVGLRMNNNSQAHCFHLDNSKVPAVFIPIGLNAVEDLKNKKGMVFEPKNISLPQYFEAMGMVTALMAQGLMKYDLMNNNCATTAAQVIRAAGIPIPLGVWSPAQLQNSFRSLP